MKLSEKLIQLRQDVYNEYGLSDEIEDGFIRCIDHAQKLEHKKILPKALTSSPTECTYCDGCGWHEGGETLKTECKECKGTGLKPKKP